MKQFGYHAVESQARFAADMSAFSRNTPLYGLCDTLEEAETAARKISQTYFCEVYVFSVIGRYSPEVRYQGVEE